MENYIASHPELRTQRFLKYYKCVAAPVGIASTCRYCGTTKIPPRRKTFCSQSCVDNYMIRISSSYLRNMVYKRDKGICSMCNVDTKKIAKRLIEEPDLRAEYNITAKRKIWKQKHGGGLWDADHIVRVEHGGGLCGLENIRTLCISCHKSVT